MFNSPEQPLPSPPSSMLFILSSGAQTGHVLAARLRVLSLNSSFLCPDSSVQLCSR